MSAKLSKMPRAEQWADRICSQLGKSVESIIEVGQLLVKAQADLAHGEWARMFAGELVPFSKRTADRLIAIAKSPLLSNGTHVSHLPPSWGTLYELTKVEPKRLTAAFKDGIITPDMPRKAVAALLPPKKKKPAKVAQEPASEVEPAAEDYEDRFDERSAIVSVIHAVRSIVATWPQDVSLQPLITQLRHEAERLEQRQERHAS